MRFGFCQGFFGTCGEDFFQQEGSFYTTSCSPCRCCWWESPQAARTAPPGRSSMSFTSPANRLFNYACCICTPRSLSPETCSWRVVAVVLFGPSLIVGGGWGSCSGVRAALDFHCPPLQPRGVMRKCVVPQATHTSRVTILRIGCFQLQRVSA